MKKNKGALKIIMTMTFFFVIVVICYFYIQTRTTPIIQRKDKDKSEVEDLMTKDLENSYPSTPREVVKLYSRYAKCFYNENIDDTTIDSLANKIRILFDEELLENNPIEDYLLDLKIEITTYRKANRNMVNVVLQKNDEIKYWSIDNKEYASLITSFSFKENSNYTKSYEKFTLRKNDDGNWKILGWASTGEVDLSSESEE